MDLDRTAIHEAGHVVIARALGLATKSAALTHDEAEETGAYGVALGPDPRWRYDGEDGGKDAMRAECVGCCAGLAAEHVFFGVPLDLENENAQSDFANIIHMESEGMPIRGKRGGMVGDEQTWRFIELRLKEAAKLVRRHRDDIRKLADALLARKRLTADEVEAVLS